MTLNDSYFSCPNRRGKAVCQVDLDSDNSFICVHCGESTIGRNDGTLMIEVMNDIFDGQPEKCIMVQQVNCQGVMGSGLAKAIRDKYPVVYEHYRAEYELGLLELGYTSYIEVEENKLVANICGQDRYGRDGKQYTNYEALRKGLEDVKMMAEALNLTVVLPTKIGCGLGGGDWEGVVLPMIDEVFRGDLIAFVFQGGDDINDESKKGTRQKHRSYGTRPFTSNGEGEIQDF